MSRDRSERGANRAPGTNPAELDALGDVISAAAAMADRARIEAAGELLRRALDLVRARDDAATAGVDRGGRERGTFRTP